MDFIKALIIEDEENARQLLRAMLEEYCEGVEVLGEAGNVKEGVSLIQKHQPDLVFLDIEMPMASGFSLFKHFDRIDFEVIFTTAYGQYAIKAIKLAALDYLMKPIHLEELMESLERYRAKKTKDLNEDTTERYQNLDANLQNNALDKKIALPTSNGYLFVKISDIVRCQADKSYTMFVLNDKTEIWTSKGLAEYDTILSEFGFLRVHRSHLINPSFITQFIKGKTPVVYLEDGSEIPVTSGRDELFQFFVKP